MENPPRPPRIELLESFKALLVGQNLPERGAEFLTVTVALIAIVLLSFLANFVAKRLILAALHNVIRRSKAQWDDAFLRWKVFQRLSHLAPALVVYILAPLAFHGYPRLTTVAAGASQIYLIIVAVIVIDSLLNAVLDIYQTFPASREIPIKSFVQVLKIVGYGIGVIWALSVVIGQTPLYLFSGLGALTAVLMLIFKDPILGFVAGIQLTGNRMVAVGDWIEMPKYNADGDVVEVALTTVKVRNWDKTITTIPTYALISDSFKNWRGMTESGGRRIKRALFLDMQTIRFCSEEMLKRFSRITYIADYIEAKKKELAEYNTRRKIDLATLANGRRLTNIGTFRAYVVAYLRNHPMIHQNMTFLVRHLAPTEHGLPMEIYVFSKDQRWVQYEGIQADIFDHILAVLPEFDLRVFQAPSGADFRHALTPQVGPVPSRSS